MRYFFAGVRAQYGRAMEYRVRGIQCPSWMRLNERVVAGDVVFFVVVVVVVVWDVVVWWVVGRSSKSGWVDVDEGSKLS